MRPINNTQAQQIERYRPKTWFDKVNLYIAVSGISFLVGFIVGILYFAGK